MSVQKAVVVDLSQSTRAVVSKTGAYLLRGGQSWWIDARELRRLVAAVTEPEPTE